MDILLVEDNAADARLTREAFREGRIENHMNVAQDGVEALAYLRREGKYRAARRPDLILLDLNLPRMSGLEVLERIKVDDDLRRIPVVVLTTSGDERDVHQAYDLHANCYIKKPVDLDQFVNIARSIHDFWLRVVRLPAA